MYWLLNGVGTFPKNVEKVKATTTPPIFNSEVDGKKIQRIVVFFNDGTFEEYKK